MIKNQYLLNKNLCSFPLIATATFDPYDEAEATASLDAFAELNEDGEHGHLSNTKAGVHDFEFVSVKIDECGL